MSRRKGPGEGDFDGLLRDGLSSQKSYVVLKQKSRSPVFLQFKPFIVRLNPQVLYIGGKLSAFPDMENEKFQGLNPQDKLNVLTTAWKKLPKDRVSAHRVGSNAGFMVVAGNGDEVLFNQRFDKGHMIHKLLEAIEEAMGIEVSNKPEVVAYLSLTYHKQLGNFFQHSARKTADRPVGKKTEILIGEGFVFDQGISQKLLTSVGLLKGPTQKALPKAEEETDVEP